MKDDVTAAGAGKKWVDGRRMDARDKLTHTVNKIQFLCKNIARGPVSQRNNSYFFSIYEIKQKISLEKSSL